MGLRISHSDWRVGKTWGGFTDFFSDGQGKTRGSSNKNSKHVQLKFTHDKQLSAVLTKPLLIKNSELIEGCFIIWIIKLHFYWAINSVIFQTNLNRQRAVSVSHNTVLLDNRNDWCLKYCKVPMFFREVESIKPCTCHISPKPEEMKILIKNSCYFLHCVFSWQLSSF